MRSRRSKIAPGSETVIGAGEGEADASDGIAFGKPVEELFADTSLFGFETLGIVLLPLLEFGGEMDGGRTFNGVAHEFIDGGDDTPGVELPVDKESIGGQAAVERAGGDSIEVRNKAARDGAEAVEIEMSVAGFEGIEGPFDVTDAAMEGFVALKEFQKAADATIAIGGEDAGHMRVDVGSVVTKADHAESEADHNVAIECADNLASGAGGDNERDVGLGLEIGFAPDFALDIDAAMEFFKFVALADEDVWGHGYVKSSEL